MGVTLKILAEYTGFSIATISRVLNNDPTMSAGEETRQIIFAAAQKLGYIGGSGRRTQRVIDDTMTIGIAEMMTPAEQVYDPYFLYLKNFIDHSCLEKKIQTISMRVEKNGVRLLSATGIDGIIAIGYFSKNQIQSMQMISRNIVFLDSSPDELHYDSVMINFDLGIQQAVDYLRELKHTRIGFIGPKRLRDDIQHITYEPRRRFFEHYMRELGLYCSEYVLEAPLRDRETAEKALELHLHTKAREDLPTAMIAVNEECAIAALHALKGAGFSVPNDMSVVSFNDTVVSSVVEPSLTSVSPHLDYMANTAVRMVIERASTPRHPLERKYPQKVIIPPELIKRDSTSQWKV